MDYIKLILLVFITQASAEPISGGLLALMGVGMLVSAVAGVATSSAGIRGQKEEGKRTRAFNLDIFKKEQVQEQKQFDEELAFKEKELSAKVDSDMFKRQQDFVWKFSDNLMTNTAMNRNLVQLGKRRAA